ncbi:MAG TPA: TonB-dependent receptor [Candidatus Polarisedimenticolaceae bacterium]|nr:TonB-dependent receptor [Candidatus Polarisedimenticolaceae bacterium]
MRVLLGLLLGGLLAAPVTAQDAEPSAEPVPTDVEERVEVSATVAKDRRDPASFTDLDAEQIRWEHDGQDLSTLLGDMTAAYSYSDAGNGFGYSYLRIRGFDQSRIAVNVDGVPLNTPESHQLYTIDLGDFAAGLGLIQVQRGPGTALYGSPAIGGVVNLETGPLSTTAGGTVEAGYGSFDTSRISFRYGGPIGKSPWAWAVRAAHVESDGYRDPSWSRQTFAHVAFERFDPKSVWRIQLFGGPEETQLSYLGVPFEYLSDSKLRRTNFLLPGETDTFVQPQLQVKNDRRLAPGLFLTNTVYAIYGDGYFRQFGDVVTPDVTYTSAWRKRSLDNRQVGWIPRIGWQHARGELSGGAELLFHRGRHQGKVTETETPVTGTPVLYDYTNEKDTMNVFVREAFRATGDLTVNVELQATAHRFRMRKDRVDGRSWDGSYDFLTPRLGLNWNVSDAWNLYAQAVQTRSEPAFGNVFDPEDPFLDPATRFASFDPSKNRYSDPFAKPERLRSYELGAGFRRGTTRAKVNLYRMDFRDEFVFAGGLDQDGVPKTSNAGRSVHQGIEVEGSFRLPGEVDLAGSVSISDDLLKEYVVFSPLAGGGTLAIDYSGNRIALFPDRLGRLSVARSFGPVRLELSGRYVGRVFLDQSENERKNPALREQAGWVDKEIDPYGIVTFRGVADFSRFVKRQAGSLTLRLTIDNLLDKRYAQFGYAYATDETYTDFYNEFFPAATRSFLAGLSFTF